MSLNEFLYCKERKILLWTYSLRTKLFLTKLVWQLWSGYGVKGSGQSFWALLRKCHDTRIVILILTLRIVLCLCTVLSSLERP